MFWGLTSVDDVTNQGLTVVTLGFHDLTDLQVADGQPHDGCLVQLTITAAVLWDLLRQLRENLRLSSTTTAGRITRLLLPLLRIPLNIFLKYL